ncbi:FGFR1 oncogene partner 2 homolog isoform X2 [Harmonia axyridis]|uniref:FGFR1 oncogene partner 2 homolog isoform X2 n=1 Tax=Harmonia axyridis TaxID=115357 RepID=UPI001E2795BB|nr:FGFR1 oncogene partner 2 homolog isoform X2 [Harmonia axyridis]
MSLTLQQVICNASRLAKRLQEEDEIADTLLSETNQIHQKIDAMKQFQEDVEHLNDVANQKPHSQLIANIQKENRLLKEIQQENRELRAALEEYQTTLEHIMFKYRQHTAEKIYKTRINFKNLQNNEYHNIIRKQAEKIQEMAAVMQKAAELGEDNCNADVENATKLTTENKGLREILGISNQYGSIKLTMEDKNIQTEPLT